MTTSPPALTLWAATVRNRSVADRLVAARAGGFTAQSVFVPDIEHWLAAGHPLAALREQARAGGAPITAIDSLARWLPGWQPPAEMSPEQRAFLTIDADTYLDYAAELEVQKVSVIVASGPRYLVPALVAGFQRICDAANERKLRVQVEFMPFGSIQDLATGWEVVRRADRDNGGLVFDTWHYYRGRPDNALLAQIPGEKIFSLQLADAPTAVQGASLDDEQMHFRRVPGEGDFPLSEVVRILRASGGLSDVGVELFSDELDALPAAEVGQRTGEALRRLLYPTDPPA